MDKKNKKEEKSFEEMTVIEKYKSDKKYKAKVQLIGYGVFIALIIIYLNIANMNTPHTGNFTVLPKENNNKQPKTKEESPKKVSLLENITNNYEYSVKINIKEKKEETNKEIQYYGKRYKENTEITKEEESKKDIFYKIDEKYYKKGLEALELVKEEEIYNVIDKKFIELDEVKEYIKLSSLDHVTEYSSGKKEYVYHLKVKDIIKNYQELDEIEINIKEENDNLEIQTDIYKLLKDKKENIENCEIIYQYTNIDKVEEFTIKEENNQQ